MGNRNSKHSQKNHGEEGLTSAVVAQGDCDVCIPEEMEVMGKTAKRKNITSAVAQGDYGVCISANENISANGIKRKKPDSAAGEQDIGASGYESGASRIQNESNLTVSGEGTEVRCLHTDSFFIEEALTKLPDDEKLMALGAFFRVFGETSRLRILYLLYGRELCVCDIAEYLNASVSAVSHQLKILKNARLVKFRKEGKNYIYSLDDSHISKILSQGMEHIGE